MGSAGREATNSSYSCLPAVRRIAHQVDLENLVPARLIGLLIFADAGTVDEDEPDRAVQKVDERVETDMAPHPQRLTVTRRAWPLARPLTTAHGVETTVDVVLAEISDVESRGRGEAVPLRRYGESIDSVVAALDAMKGAVTSGLDRDALQGAMPPGAARNALDCAFWDMD